MKVTYESCTVYVVGLDLNCPMCGVLVPSGTLHKCPEANKPKKTRKKVSK